MPVNIEVAHRIMKELGGEIPIRGAVSGPFSLAVTLFGVEEVFVLAMNDPEEMKIVLQKCTDVIKVYGLAFIDTGCGIVVFDSQATPELISPAMYRKLIMPFHTQLVDYFKSAGCMHVPIVIGGNTTPILDDYIATGANNILCDSNADYVQFLEKCIPLRRSFRRNIPTIGFLQLQPDDLYNLATDYLEKAQGYAGFILGTGVIPYGTPTENILAIRCAVNDFDNYG